MSSAPYIIKQIEVGGHPFTVEIADTPKKRAVGLMDRQTMDPHGGMLFVLDNEPASFHMNNTYVPLDIAYFDSRGDMIQADKMEPLTGKSRCDVPASYALELPMGTCDRLEIKKGDRLSITESRGRLRESYEEIVDVGVRVRVNTVGPKKPTMRDITTDIRGLPNVITVAQEGSLQSAPEGKRMATLTVSFNDDERFDVPDLERDLLKIGGIDLVRIVSYEGQPYNRKKVYGVKSESLLRRVVSEILRSAGNT